MSDEFYGFLPPPPDGPIMSEFQTSSLWGRPNQGLAPILKFLSDKLDPVPPPVSERPLWTTPYDNYPKKKYIDILT